MSPSSFLHHSVLLQEVVTALTDREWDSEVFSHECPIFVDGTLGGAGHSKAVFEAMAKRDVEMTLVGLDRDPVALTAAKTVLEPYLNHCHLVQSAYAEMSNVLTKPVTGGILLDLGISSPQVDTAERGFSFTKEGPLDMRMNPDQPMTAAMLVNTATENELCRIFREYGEERYARPIARRIIERRQDQPFETTTVLAKLVEGMYYGASKGKKKRGDHEIHPATRVFQALRIAVNEELNQLETLLADLPTLLAPGARVAIISFHSLEDRLVKHAFREQSLTEVYSPYLSPEACKRTPTLKLITSKPILPTEPEMKANPRSRSAKLRVAERLP